MNRTSTAFSVFGDLNMIGSKVIICSSSVSFSSLNSLPKGINVESSDPENGGYHIEDGGYIYYIHPQWESTWGGNLKFKGCDVDKIEPKPNRFVWVNPNVWHGIEVVDSSANTNRVTVVAWPTGTVEYANANVIINTNI